MAEDLKDPRYTKKELHVYDFKTGEYISSFRSANIAGKAFSPTVVYKNAYNNSRKRQDEPLQNSRGFTWSFEKVGNIRGVLVDALPGELPPIEQVEQDWSKRVDKKRVYYAHSLHIYNTPQETRDILILEAMGFEVVNPNTDFIREGLETHKRTTDSEYMDFFETIIKSCDILAFRSIVDLKIGAGVAKEITMANMHNIPIIELPTLTTSRALSIDETREYLHYNGQR